MSILVFFLFLYQVDIDFEKEPIGHGKDGNEVYLRGIWPTNEEIEQVGTNAYITSTQFQKKSTPVVYFR